MKLVAIVGTNADFSYNRLLLKFMQQHFWRLAEIEIAEIKDLPAFSTDLPLAETTPVWRLRQQVKAADGVIFATPEYDHAIPAALKSALEWLSYHTTALHNKPAMIVGVSYGRQGTARAQQQMRKMLLSPDCQMNVLPGNEVLIGNAANVFTEDGRLTNQAEVDNLEQCFSNFVEYVDVFKKVTRGEQLMAVNRPMIEEAYINFPTGRLSLREVQAIFNTIPFEIDLIDATDRFSWYSNKPNRVHVRNVNQLGETYSECHPPKAVPAVEAIINSFKDGTKDVVNRPMTFGGKRVLIRYYALRDVDGHYLGTIEFTGYVEDILQMAENGAWSVDTTTCASKAPAEVKPIIKSTVDETPATQAPSAMVMQAAKERAADANTGASSHDEGPAPEESSAVDQTESTPVSDADTGASQASDTPEVGEADAMTGASAGGDMHY